jgi:predicted enzyme related to lactoylglutathione lyase
MNSQGEEIRQRAGDTAGMAPTESFVILYHEDMAAARRFYEGVLGLQVREVTYDWFIGYWVSDKHEMTLCISTSPEERARWGAGGKGVVLDFVVPDVDEACARLEGRGARFLEPPTDKQWGLRTANLLDPAGYTVTITSYRRASKEISRKGARNAKKK